MYIYVVRVVPFKRIHLVQLLLVLREEDLVLDQSRLDAFIEQELGEH